MYYSSSYDSKKSDNAKYNVDSNFFGSDSPDFSLIPFMFPPAPRICKSANNTSCSVSCQSDSSISDGQILTKKKRHRKKQVKVLPPIGVFWDIENCQVPKNKSASSIAQRIREFFFTGYREAEFLVVCDVKKENAQVVQDLHDAQVNLIHVSSTCKNAADEKLRQSLRRFADVHRAPATIILITGDVNFAADLSDLRYRKKIHVILVHNTNAADALILCANETYPFSSITDNLPVFKTKTTECADVYVSNLPINYDKRPLRNRLKFLSDNCGGRVVDVNNGKGRAVIRFASNDLAVRAQRRLNGEDVYGNKIRVSNTANWRDNSSPRHFGSGRKIMKNPENFQVPFSVPPPGYNTQETASFYTPSQRDIWRSNQEKTGSKLVLQEPNSFRNRSGGSLNVTTNQESGTWRRGSFSRPRTPQDEGHINLTTPRTQKVNVINSEFSEHSKFYSPNNTFQSIANHQQQSTPNVSSSPVELIITNLDGSFKDLRSYLMNLLKEYAMVYSVNISNQQDGSPLAIVKVSCQQDAQNIISQLHHFKLGYKRLAISYVQNNCLDPSQLKEMVIILLKEAPGDRMPLYRLLNLLETRYLTNVSVSEINKLRDICRITEEYGERILQLTPEVRSSPPSNLHRAQILFCSVHCPNGFNTPEDFGLGETEDSEMSEITNIKMSLKEFTSKLNTLMSSHMGTLPLLSFAVCYKYEFGELLPVDNAGVPLEHLITCVANVELKYGGVSRNIKYIKRELDLTLKTNESDKEDSLSMKSLSPSITSSISLLCRELVDLLKMTERCQLQLNKFIPAYHHHFGRQCRVADYGYTKLGDLLHSLPISNIVQILGDGGKRIITLTHTTQMRRFTSDLLRVLKTQISKQLTSSEFPMAYERVLNKPFNAVEYGLCTLEDLLEEVPENTVVIKRTDVVTIAIPKREQTCEEMVRTKQFAEEVIKLLSYSPQCSMLFNKFVPAYHHHFGHQCKVSDYGFTKLIELFEAIPDTIKVEELSDGERKISLTLQKALKLRGMQIADLIKNSLLSSVPLEALTASFLREYGHALKPSTFDCQDVAELVSKLGEFVKITFGSAGPLLVLVNNDSESTLALRVWALLIQPPHSLHLGILINKYNTRYQSNISVNTLESLNNVIISRTPNTDTIIFLTPQYVTAAQLYQMLYQCDGHVPYNSLSIIFYQHCGKCLLQSAEDSYEKVLAEFSFILGVRRTKKKTLIVLNPKISEYGLQLPNGNGGSFSVQEESLCWPPPPVHDLCNDSSNRGITPPKPDTPPAPGSAPWKNWDTPTKYSNIDLTITLPAMQTPKLMASTDYLTSPTRTLLNAHSHPLGASISMISAPPANEVPMPDKLVAKGLFGDDSTDSGVNNSHVASENEMDLSAENTGMKSKCLLNPDFFTSFATSS